MSVHGADDTASRHTSISKRPASTVSRAQTLIKRNIAVNDLKPSDILIDRFQAWKHIVKMLIAYFEGVADIENNTARELTRLGGVIQVPFKAGNQFLGEGGMQDVFYNIRDKTRLNADHHANFAKTVDGSIVQHLQKLRAEIKAHVKNVQNDTGRLAANVAKERELSTRTITDLAKAINVLKNSPMGVMAREDPYCANVVVHKQLMKQVNEENSLQKSIILMQHNSANFEEGIVRSIQSAWQTFDEWQTRMVSDVQETWRALTLAMGNVPPTREWVAFAGRSDHLLDPDTPLRNPEHVDYPGKDDPSVIPVHVGLLERKKRFTRSYGESYFVLTPAGYLHEYTSSDPRTHTHPTFSLFLPACTLGPPSSARTSKSHKFHIESRKDSVPGHGKFHIGSKEVAYTFRARSHDEMMEWWNDVRMLVARYLVASEAMERHGPIEAAVRAAGYLSEEEEEEEGGSSMEDPEEDEGEGEDGQRFEPANDGTEAIAYGHEGEEAAPAYTGPAREMITMGPNGYPLDKKHPRLPAEDHERQAPGGYPSVSSPSQSHGPTQDPEVDHGPISETTDIKRRLSRRQEKAPEGQAPRRRPISTGEDLMPAPAPMAVEAPRAHEPVTLRDEGVVPPIVQKRENGSAVGGGATTAPTSPVAPAAAPTPAAQPGIGYVPTAPPPVTMNMMGAIDYIPAPPTAHRASLEAAPVSSVGSANSGSDRKEVSPTAQAAITTAAAPGFLGAPVTAEPAGSDAAGVPLESVATQTVVAEPARSEQPAIRAEPLTVTTATTEPVTASEAGAGPAPAEADGEADGAADEPFEDAAEGPASPADGTTEDAAGEGAADSPTTSPTSRKSSKLTRKEKRKSRDDGEKPHGLFSRFKEALK